MAGPGWTWSLTEQSALGSNLVNGRPHGIGDNCSLFFLRHTDVAHMPPEAGYSACVARGWTVNRTFWRFIRFICDGFVGVCFKYEGIYYFRLFRKDIDPIKNTRSNTGSSTKIGLISPYGGKPLSFKPNPTHQQQQ